jgi:hypothetical protein
MERGFCGRERIGMCGMFMRERQRREDKGIEVIWPFSFFLFSMCGPALTEVKLKGKQTVKFKKGGANM